MEKEGMAKVPVTDEDRKKPYFKYYERDVISMVPEKMPFAFGEPMTPMDAVPFTDRARILTDEGIGTRIGYTVMPDGTGYMSDVTFMPGVTADMLDWYMAWRGLDPLRFVIANPENNVSAMSMQTSKFADEDLIGAEKYWDTTQMVIKMSDMGPAKEAVNFKCPSDVGFDMEVLKSSNTASLICARGYAHGQPPAAGPDYLICHQVIEKEDGVEVRTKCWIGWTVRYGKDYKQLPDGFFMPPVFAMGVFLQNVKEWANLATILPQLYAEEHGE